MGKGKEMIFRINVMREKAMKFYRQSGYNFVQAQKQNHKPIHEEGSLEEMCFLFKAVLPWIRGCGVSV